jgi:hypothetical protein
MLKAPCKLINPTMLLCLVSKQITSCYRLFDGTFETQHICTTSALQSTKSKLAACQVERWRPPGQGQDTAAAPPTASCTAGKAAAHHFLYSTDTVCQTAVRIVSTHSILYASLSRYIQTAICTRARTARTTGDLHRLLGSIFWSENDIYFAPPPFQ